MLAIDGHVDEVDVADLVVQGAVGKPELHLDGVDIGVLVLAGLQHVGLAHRKGHIHRVLADDERQRPGVGADHIAFGDVGPADLSGDGRVDVGVAEIDVRGVQIGFVGQDLAFGLLVGGERLVARHDSAGLSRHQLLGALELNLGERFCRLAALQGALGLLDGGLEESRLDLIERRAFLDEVALLELHVLEEALHPRHDLDAVHGLDPADEVLGFRDRLELGLDHSDWNGGRRGRLPVGGEGGADGEHQEQRESHGQPLQAQL